MTLNSGVQIVIITGSVHEGKSTLAENICMKMKKEEMRVGGFLSKATFSEGNRIGYILKDVDTGESMQLAATEPGKNTIPQGRFHLNPAAFRYGEAIVRKCIEKEMELVVMDEIGMMEAEYKGWFNAMETVAPVPCKKLWVVRQSVLEEIRHQWKVPEESVFSCKAPLEKVIYKLKSL